MNIEFLGRLHPAMVHLPIGIFLLALLMQYLAPKKLRQEKGLVRIILFFCMLAAAGSTLFGWILSWSGDYSPVATQRHQWPAVAFTIAISTLFFLHWKFQSNQRTLSWYHALFFLTFLLLLVTLYFGNALTHGDSFGNAEAEKETLEELAAAESKNPLPEIKLPDVAMPDSLAISKAKQAGFVVRPVSQSSRLLEVSSVNMEQCKDVDLKLLEPFAGNIVWLQITGKGITDAALPQLVKFGNLRKLNLKQSLVTDASMKLIVNLKSLEYLNLVGTQVGDRGLEALKLLASIKKIYCWQSKITALGIASFQKQHPGVLVAE